jgi:DNA ligase D-like protein (predicted 3'-phosphoesterase)
MAGRFVVQLHDATTLHYDFRLEVDGTLRSWAVPKGPSTDPAQRRLAVEVGDHALAHLTHESARVEIWDTGTFRNLDADRSIAEALDAGHARFWLDGRRLHGGWTLHRTGDGRGPKTQWLLMKRRDDEEHE